MFVNEHPKEILRIWCDLNYYEDSALRFHLTQGAQVAVGAVPAADVAPKPAEPKPVVPRMPSRVVPVPAPKPAEPGLWDSHVRPFLIKNWSMVAGISMVIVGSSLLAYYTWDKKLVAAIHALLSLLGFFTMALAWGGNWIEKQGQRFKSNAAMLRGAAIGLLPANFMAIALLAGDPQVLNKPVLVPAMAILYLVAFGIGLRHWCAAVYKPLGGLLVGSLIVLNGLVALVPVAQALSASSPEQLLPMIGAGFYVGFAVLAMAVIVFSKKYLTRELAQERIVPWFVGVTLGVTFLQVFVWVHGFIHHLPRVYTYAPLVILAGWLILFVERRVAELQSQSEMHQLESFLGFAFILLGVMMSVTEPAMRTLSFTLAGAVWIYQSIARRHALHYWIGLTFLSLGVASIATWNGFPELWIPALGLGLAVFMGILSRMAENRKQKEFGEACIGMQVAILMVTVTVATLLQWRLHSDPLYTAVELAIVAVLFAWRAHRDQSLRWVHLTMVVVALVLPYAGFADMRELTLQGNTMVFALSLVAWMWIAIVQSSKNSLLREARSTVLWLYGALAVTGMVLRVLFEQARPGNAMISQLVMDHSGPLLMTMALVATAYFSRSLVPSAMAIAIIVILFPELKTELETRFPTLSWGSGFGSGLFSWR